MDIDGERFAFSQLPAALEAKNLYVAPGALISPEVMLREIEFFESRKNPPEIAIDPRCHVVLPLHRTLNLASEAYKGKNKIGSVGKGIGACVEDRTNRTGLRIYDLQDRKRLKERLSMLWEIRQRQIIHVFGNENFSDSFQEQFDFLFAFGKRVAPYLRFTNQLLAHKMKNNESILLECSQATFLDNIYGTYPYGVAYQSLVQSCFPLMGLPPSPMRVLGVMKAYMIRVGNGPFPTELNVKDAEDIRTRGREFGTVSGRPRRCGWLDLPLIKHAVHMNGVSEIALTNVDVLAERDSVEVCIGYKVAQRNLSVDQALLELDQVEPEMKSFSGWCALTDISSYEDFPESLKYFISYVEDFVGARIKFVSYGPSRSATIERSFGVFRKLNSA